MPLYIPKWLLCMQIKKTALVYNLPQEMRNRPTTSREHDVAIVCEQGTNLLSVCLLYTPRVES